MSATLSAFDMFFKADFSDVVLYSKEEVEYSAANLECSLYFDSINEKEDFVPFTLNTKNTRRNTKACSIPNTHCKTHKMYFSNKGKCRGCEPAIKCKTQHK